MDIFGIILYHHSYVAFPLFVVHARLVCKCLNLRSMSMDDMISEMKKKCTFDGELQDRHITRCTTVSLDVFRKNDTIE